MLLAIFAHPDDESFGPGATLARYAAQGIDVHVIIATDGIAGSVEAPDQLENHISLAQVRSQELSDAAVALGITTIWSLPYRDSGMQGTPENEHPEALIQQPLSQVAAEIAEYIHRLQPEVIITHDPFGGYGHPDHIHVCHATTEAFHQTRQTLPTLRKLYYTAFDKRYIKMMVRLMPFFGQDPTAIGRNKDIDLVEISGWETPIHAKIAVGDYLDKKDRASRAHVSQYSGGPSALRFLPAFVRKRVASTDSYTRAYPEPDGVIETDLFCMND